MRDEYGEVNQKIDDIIQNLLKLKDELNNNKDNVRILFFTKGLVHVL